MVKINIFFKDLQENAQEEVWALVSKQLLDEQWITREKGESQEAFEARLWEETDHYINTHNFASEYVV